MDYILGGLYMFDWFNPIWAWLGVTPVVGLLIIIIIILLVKD